MKDILKKAMVGLVAYGGLEYVKYRVKGGRPLLKRAMDVLEFLNLDWQELEDKKGSDPITLESGDYSVV